MSSDNSIEGCSLSILVARPDVGYMMHTIPHLVRMCAFPFKERTLVIDDAELPSRYDSLPSVGSMKELHRCCESLIAAGVVDNAWSIDYSKQAQRETYKTHLKAKKINPRDWRGYPNLGSMQAIDRSKYRYFLHFDADIMMFQRPGFNWIESGIEMLKANPDVMFASPLSGPPTSDGSLDQRGESYNLDEKGFYRIDSFTSRKYLLDKDRLKLLLPLSPRFLSWKRRTLARFTGASATLSWEIMVAERLRETGYSRADLSSHDAWALHTPDHGAEFLARLPGILDAVERGYFPAKQAGNYDLDLSIWQADLVN